MIRNILLNFYISLISVFLSLSLAWSASENHLDTRSEASNQFFLKNKVHHTLAFQFSPNGLNDSQFNQDSHWNFLQAQYGYVFGKFFGEWEGGLIARAAFLSQFQSEPVASPQIYNFAIGPQLQYRAIYFENQFLVPVFKASWDYQLIKNREFGEIVKNSYPQWGAGAWLYLNAFDRKSAGMLKAELGVKRTYFTFDYSQTVNQVMRKQNSTQLKNYLLGLRLEI